jgi:MarR family transcriptional regulator, lower aerobic nicotinate degradation pathway regulator
VEFALVAVEDEVLGGLDDEQRETLYSLLQQATRDHALNCPGAIDEC